MRIPFLLGLLAIAGNLLATALPLSGRVLTAPDNQPLEYATVSVYTSDSTLVEGTITDAEGRFSFVLERGNYRIEVGFLGLQSRRIPVDLQRRTELADIVLSGDNVVLDAVEVRADRSRMNLLLDKKVFNVGEDLLAAGGSADRVLDQLPSVTVSPEGEVSLRGNSGVRILVNGRPSTLATNSLEAIPAASIERVEIITNPSARFEAAGTAGIINIILKQETNKGYGGSASLSTGYPDDHRANLNLNLRREKISAFANIGGRFSSYRGEAEEFRLFSEEGAPVRLDRTMDQERVDRAGNAYVGLDYQLSEAATLTAAYSINHVVNDDESITRFRFSDGAGDALRGYDQPLDYLEPGTYHQLDLTYARQIGEGRKFSAYLKNDSWRETETEITSLTDRFAYQTVGEESSTDWLLQADYEMPLGEGGKFEIGGRAETRVISSDYLAERQLTDGSYQPIPGFENVFDYFERIGSGYGQYARQGEKVGIQLGLRAEYTDITTENSVERSANISKDYLRLFPSASLSYRLSGAGSTQLSYSRRIRRPWFGGLNPFGGIGDPTSLYRGNPDLDPTYTDRLELNFIHRTEKVTVNPALYGSRSTDYLEFYLVREDENVFGLEAGTIIELPINLDREYRYGIELTTGYRPTEQLTLSHEINVYGYSQRGAFDDQNFDYDFLSWQTSGRISLDLPKKIQFQGSIQYQARVEEAQSVRKPYIGGTLGLSKRWGERLTLSANLRAPQWQRWATDREGLQQEQRRQWTGWRSTLTLRYQFERGADAAARRERGSIR